MNWYVLFVLADRQDRLLEVLKTNGLDAFSPVWEYYRRDIQTMAQKLMFPGYIFVRSPWSRAEFAAFIQALGDRKRGLVKELRRNQLSGEDEPENFEAAALRQEEIDFLSNILDENDHVVMSYGFIGKKGKAVVTRGPLIMYEDKICKLDKHNHLAWLNLSFFDRQIKMGLTVADKYRQLQNASSQKKEKIIEDVQVMDEDSGEMVAFDPEALMKTMMGGGEEKKE